MGLKKLIKSVAPKPLWEYLRYKKALHIMKEYLMSTDLNGINAFAFLDDVKDYDATGKIFENEQYYSQAYQDYFLDRFVFRKKEHGFFLDIGGNDPFEINNTYFFEKNRNWEGLAFEPIEEQRIKWNNRKTECLPFALGSSDGEAEFCEYNAHGMSGLSEEVNYSGTLKKRYKVPVRRLTTILNERGIKHIDFASLDVEGAEIEVLNGIDFSKIQIDCFTIENNKGWQKEECIRKFMINAGYKLKAKLWIDEIWIKK